MMELIAKMITLFLIGWSFACGILLAARIFGVV